MKVQYKQRERGIVLIVSLIMLMAMTLLAIAAINMSSTNLRLVNAMQTHSEALAAAESTLNSILGTNFTANLTAIPTTYNQTSSSTVLYAVAVTQPCLVSTLRMTPAEVQTSSLSAADKVKCSEAVKDINGVVIASQSVCSNTVWHMKATARDDRAFGSYVEVHQGAGITVHDTNLNWYLSNGASYGCVASVY